jgi:hypothetical protein
VAQATLVWIKRAGLVDISKRFEADGLIRSLNAG